MAGKAKFDQEAAFKSIEEEQGSCAASLLFRSGH